MDSLDIGASPGTTSLSPIVAKGVVLLETAATSLRASPGRRKLNTLESDCGATILSATPSNFTGDGANIELRRLRVPESVGLMDTFDVGIVRKAVAGETVVDFAAAAKTENTLVAVVSASENDGADWEVNETERIGPEANCELKHVAYIN